MVRGIHSGAQTHHHDQATTLHSLRTIKTTSTRMGVNTQNRYFMTIYF